VCPLNIWPMYLGMCTHFGRRAMEYRTARPHVDARGQSFHHDVLKQGEDSYEVNALESYSGDTLAKPALQY
jgi:hypothetical protein